MDGADRVVVMGVSGAGKSTVGAALAARLGVPFVDADQLHPPGNVEKMRAGAALTDEDRRPWLAALGRAMGAEPRVVVACSALKRSYRDVLRAADNVRFVNLLVGVDQAVGRVAERRHHFFGAPMVASQFATLEPPGPDETDVASIDAGGDVTATVEAAVAALRTVRPLAQR